VRVFGTDGRLVTAAPLHVNARENDVVWAGIAPGTWIVAEYHYLGVPARCCGCPGMVPAKSGG
jgi:hypothetical protein